MGRSEIYLLLSICFNCILSGTMEQSSEGFKGNDISGPWQSQSEVNQPTAIQMRANPDNKKSPLHNLFNPNTANAKKKLKTGMTDVKKKVHKGMEDFKKKVHKGVATRGAPIVNSQVNGNPGVSSRATIANNVNKKKERKPEVSSRKMHILPSNGENPGPKTQVVVNPGYGGPPDSASSMLAVFHTLQHMAEVLIPGTPHIDDFSNEFVPNCPLVNMGLLRQLMDLGPEALPYLQQTGIDLSSIFPGQPLPVQSLPGQFLPGQPLPVRETYQNPLVVKKPLGGRGRKKRQLPNADSKSPKIAGSSKEKGQRKKRELDTANSNNPIITDRAKESQRKKRELRNKTPKKMDSLVPILEGLKRYGAMKA